MLRVISRTTVIGCSLLALASASVQVVQAPTVHVTKLNGSLAQPDSGDVYDFLLSSDGTRVIYRADHAIDNAFELFSTPADGSTNTIVLNDPLVSGGAVGGSVFFVFGVGHSYAVAAGTDRVVYLADQYTNNVDELLSVPADGSANPVRLNANLAFGQDVLEFWIAPGGQHVIFQAGTVGNSALFRAPIDGSAPAIAFTHDSSKIGVWLSPDGSTAVFGAFDGKATSLYQVPTDGSAVATFIVQSDPPLSVPPIDFSYVQLVNVTFSDDGTRIVFEQVFVTEEDGPVKSDLLTASLDGSYQPRYLNQQPLSGYFFRASVYDGADRAVYYGAPEGGIVSTTLDGSQRVVLQPSGWNGYFDGTLVFSQDRSRVVFDAGNGAQRAAFSAPVDGSQAAVQLGAGPIGNLLFTGPTVVYSTFSTHWSLFAVPLLGGTPPLLLNPPPFENAGSDIAIHPGGQEILFRADANGLSKLELYRARLDASTPPVRLSDPMNTAGNVTRFAVAGPGDFITYLADANHNETFELFGAPFAGGADVTYNGPFQSGPVVGDVLAFSVSPDEQRVFYRADEEADGSFAYYCTPADGSGTPFSLTTDMPEGGSVLASLGLSPDGTRAAIILGDGPNTSVGWLYASDATQPSVPVLLDDNDGLHTTPLLISSTGVHVVYRRQSPFAAPYVLCSARLDGVGEPLVLTLATGTVMTNFKLSEDGSEAFYLADLDLAGVIELHHVAVDGSPPSAKLNPPLAGTSDVIAFAAAPGGMHVAYVADADLDEVFELYSVPSSGGGPVVKLNGSLVAGGDVKDFAITPDGAYVVYRADQTVDQTSELFRVPIAGGTPILIMPVAGGTGVQSDYVLSTDGQTVYYRATHSAPLLTELFRVAADGSASPVMLSGPITAGGNVSSFALAPDQVHLAYIADQRTNGVAEVFGATSTPGTDVLLHAMPGSGDVIDLRIAPDSLAVVYRANVDRTFTVLELFSAPIDGSTAPARLSRPLPTAGGVEADFVALSAGRAIYRADQEENDVFELFSALRAPRGRAGRTKH